MKVTIKVTGTDAVKESVEFDWAGTDLGNKSELISAIAYTIQLKYPPTVGDISEVVIKVRR